MYYTIWFQISNKHILWYCTMRCWNRLETKTFVLMLLSSKTYKNKYFNRYIPIYWSFKLIFYLDLKLSGNIYRNFIQWLYITSEASPVSNKFMTSSFIRFFVCYEPMERVRWDSLKDSHIMVCGHLMKIL